MYGNGLRARRAIKKMGIAAALASPSLPKEKNASKDSADTRLTTYMGVISLRC